ncbi:hypothetical protein ACWKW4_16170 [Hydrogenophaga borbori]|jgi:hypothetical protein
MVRPTDHSPPAVPPDALHLGRGHLLDAGRIALLLALNQDDLSRITNVATTSVKIGDAMPPAMREWIEDIANMMNMVAEIFQGDETRTVAWFKAQNPQLGDFSPHDMIRIGRQDRLRHFILNAFSEHIGTRVSLR